MNENNWLLRPSPSASLKMVLRKFTISKWRESADSFYCAVLIFAKHQRQTTDSPGCRSPQEHLLPCSSIPGLCEEQPPPALARQQFADEAGLKQMQNIKQLIKADDTERERKRMLDENRRTSREKRSRWQEKIHAVLHCSSIALLVTYQLCFSRRSHSEHQAAASVAIDTPLGWHPATAGQCDFVSLQRVQSLAAWRPLTAMQPRLVAAAVSVAHSDALQQQAPHLTQTTTKKKQNKKHQQSSQWQMPTHACNILPFEKPDVARPRSHWQIEFVGTQSQCVRKLVPMHLVPQHLQYAHCQWYNIHQQCVKMSSVSSCHWPKQAKMGAPFDYRCQAPGLGGTLPKKNCPPAI